jgi:asparagine synthase (glutamine-hydrolysing)
MCGIAGTLNLTPQQPVEERHLRQMLAMLRHRGPDEFGIYLDDQVGLGSARLSIIDLSTGRQPIGNEDGNLWIVFNGEIFNYIELRPELETRGHRFTTQSDTEVILHLYEEYGPSCLQYLNGQFAFAIWNRREQSLFLARDRVGILPLFYTVRSNKLIFGSEIKALLAHPDVDAVLDPAALDQIFTYWSTLSPRTAFKDIVDVPPGHYLMARKDAITKTAYWQLEFPDSFSDETRDFDQCLEAFRSLLIDATQIRLRADVPVGAYLSGGLDSSTTSAVIRNYTQNRLDTFSISFSDPDFDESEFQHRMAGHLGTDHHIVQITQADIGRVFPDVIWHTEAPVLRTSPAPMYLLSKLVRDHHFKVVLTGEGADEFLGGYNIFKEAQVRRFWARQPNSVLRPLLLKRLYPYIGHLKDRDSAYLGGFFRKGLEQVDAPDYSHALRWRNTGRTRRLFSAELREAAAAANGSGGPAYPAGFERWHPLNQAQYLEATIFLSQYLLSSQGDRMVMAHSVEGRFPFLDHRLIEFSNQLPPRFKLNGLTEKYILKKVAKSWLPEMIWRRPKRPYRAPIHRSFFNEATPDYVRELVSPESLKASGLFHPPAVSQLVGKIESGFPMGETDDMAIVGIISSQLVHRQFVADFRMPPPLSDADPVKVCRGVGTLTSYL